MKTLQSIAFGMFLSLLILGIMVAVTTQPRGNPILLEVPPTPSPLKVQVLGSVVHPGMYDLPEGSRVEKAIQAAGGYTSEANPDALNPAQLIKDGDRIFAPSVDQYSIGAETKAQSLIPASTSTPAVYYPLNINTASQSDLETLPSIGPTKAQSIMKYRIEHGSFTSIEQLLDVPGIGPVLFSQIKDLVTIGEIG